MSVSPHLPVSKVVKYINGESRGKLQEEFQKLRKRYSRQYPGKPVFWRNVRTDK
ncbi:MAG: transposase [Alphaproteobacteria bacterium]|nr:transposase [Alphaproteobacteria bacterium]